MTVHKATSTPQVTAYTADISICSQICRLALHEHGLDATEHVNVDIEYVMDNFEPWFVRIQPTMKVPVLTYDDEIIGDSKDIMYFLAEKHPEMNLYPADKKVAVDQYIDVLYDGFSTIAAFTFANLASWGEEMRQFIARGKREVTRQKLQKLVQDPGFKAVAEAGLQRMEHFDFLEWVLSHDMQELDSVMKELLEQMEADLADERQFLVGEACTLNRLCHVGGYAYGEAV